jgi:hypothetical protein
LPREEGKRWASDERMGVNIYLLMLKDESGRVGGEIVVVREFDRGL